jgi:hypothetical protein
LQPFNQKFLGAGTMSVTLTELDQELRTLELAIQSLRAKVDYLLTQTEEIKADGQPQVSAEVLVREKRWQATIHHLIRVLLGLEDDQAFDPASVPSAAEIREQMTQHIPEEEKFSDLIVAMREE